MNQDFEKELQRAEREKARAQRADSFWNAFQLTENGHVKSTLLLNSFCLSIVFLAVYFAAFYLLADPIHALLSPAPLAVENLASALLPAAAGTAVCGLTHLLCRPQTVLASYLWLLALTAAILIVMLLMLHGGAGTALFLSFYAILVPAPLISGIAVSLWVLRRKGNHSLRI